MLKVFQVVSRVVHVNSEQEPSVNMFRRLPWRSAPIRGGEQLNPPNVDWRLETRFGRYGKAGPKEAL